MDMIRAEHPTITPQQAFCAIAETTGDVQHAIHLLHTDPTFINELHAVASSINVNKYISLRPAPLIGPVAAARRRRVLRRRWSEALSDPVDRRNTAIKVAEIAERETSA